MSGDLALLFAVWFVGHSFGDHWVQTSHQAVCKAKHGDEVNEGRRACAAHVATLTATKLAFTALAWFPGEIDLHPAAVALAMAVDAVSHYWADRRLTLQRLADKVGRGEFHSLGSTLADTDGKVKPHLGTGQYALDQSWHHAWLLLSVLTAAGVNALL